MGQIKSGQLENICESWKCVGRKPLSRDSGSWEKPEPIESIQWHFAVKRNINLQTHTQRLGHRDVGWKQETGYVNIYKLVQMCDTPGVKRWPGETTTGVFIFMYIPSVLETLTLCQWAERRDSRYKNQNVLHLFSRQGHHQTLLMHNLCYDNRPHTYLQHTRGFFQPSLDAVPTARHGCFYYIFTAQLSNMSSSLHFIAMLTLC